MVTKLLSVSHNEVTAMELSRFAARDVLSDAAAVCRPILAKHGNRLVTRADNCPDIIANREMLLQVLINLAVNSGKHTENGTVTFLQKDPPTVIISPCSQYPIPEREYPVRRLHICLTKATARTAETGWDFISAVIL